MDEEIFLDNACFHCNVRPSQFGLIADGLACEICQKNPKLAKLKIGLEMEKIKIVTVSKCDILRATTVKNFNFEKYSVVPVRIDSVDEDIMIRSMGRDLKSNRLVKSNAWYDKFNFLAKGIKLKLEKIDPRKIELVPFCDVDKPVVRHEQVFQLCVSDWDGDCILKDDINGVEIIKNAFTGDEMYDSAMLDYLPNHPVNSIYQIKHDDQILDGNTLELQLLVDLYYSKFRYI